MANQGSQLQTQSAEKNQVRIENQSPMRNQVQSRRGSGEFRPQAQKQESSRMSFAQFVHAAISSKQNENTVALEEEKRAIEIKGQSIGADHHKGAEKAARLATKSSEEESSFGSEQVQSGKDQLGVPEGKGVHLAMRIGDGVGGVPANGTSSREKRPMDQMTDAQILAHIQGLIAKVKAWIAAGNKLSSDQQAKYERWIRREREYLGRLRQDGGDSSEPQANPPKVIPPGSGLGPSNHSEPFPKDVSLLSGGVRSEPSVAPLEKSIPHNGPSIRLAAEVMTPPKLTTPPKVTPPLKPNPPAGAPTLPAGSPSGPSELSRGQPFPSALPPPPPIVERPTNPRREPLRPTRLLAPSAALLPPKDAEVSHRVVQPPSSQSRPVEPQSNIPLKEAAHVPGKPSVPSPPTRVPVSSRLSPAELPPFATPESAPPLVKPQPVTPAARPQPGPPSAKPETVPLSRVAHYSSEAPGLVAPPLDSQHSLLKVSQPYQQPSKPAKGAVPATVLALSDIVEVSEGPRLSLALPNSAPLSLSQVKQVFESAGSRQSPQKQTEKDTIVPPSRPVTSKSIQPEASQPSKSSRPPQSKVSASSLQSAPPISLFEHSLNFVRSPPSGPKTLKRVESGEAFAEGSKVAASPFQELAANGMSTRVDGGSSEVEVRVNGAAEGTGNKGDAPAGKAGENRSRLAWGESLQQGEDRGTVESKTSVGMGDPRTVALGPVDQRERERSTEGGRGLKGTGETEVGAGLEQNGHLEEGFAGRVGEGKQDAVENLSGGGDDGAGLEARDKSAATEVSTEDSGSEEHAHERQGFEVKDGRLEEGANRKVEDKKRNVVGTSNHQEPGEGKMVGGGGSEGEAEGIIRGAEGSAVGHGLFKQNGERRESKEVINREWKGKVKESDGGRGGSEREDVGKGGSTKGQQDLVREAKSGVVKEGKGNGAKSTGALSGKPLSPLSGIVAAIGVEGGEGSLVGFIERGTSREGKKSVPTPPNGKGGEDSSDSGKENYERERKKPEAGPSSRLGDGKELVQCQECGKMRLLGREGLVMREELNGWWTCDMAGRGASCEDPEDAEVERFPVLKTLKEEVLNVVKKLGTPKLAEWPSEKGKGAGSGLGSVSKLKPGLSSKRKLHALSESSPNKFKSIVDGKGGTGSGERKRAKDAGLGFRQTEPENKSGERGYFVPDGFTLVFTARNTEKSVAINAPGDLRYNFPLGCVPPTDAKGKSLSYIQSKTKLEEFLAANQGHPLVKGLSEADFVFSGRRFEVALKEAYGEGAERDKWVFKNRGGKIEASRAGKIVPAQQLRLPAKPPTKATGSPATGSPARKRKSVDGGGDNASKKAKTGELLKSPKLIANRLKFFAKEPQVDAGSPKVVPIVGKIKRTEGGSKSTPKRPESGLTNTKVPVVEKPQHQGSRSKDGATEEAYPDSLSDFRLQDDEGNMQPIDKLNLVQEDVEGNLKKLKLIGTSDEGVEWELPVFRWRIDVDPLRIAVKTRKANTWVSLDMKKPHRDYAPISTPLKRRLALLRPLLAAAAIDWTDIRNTMLGSLDAEADLLFVETWLRKLKPNKEEVSQAMQLYREELSRGVTASENQPPLRTVSLDASFLDGEVPLENEVTAEDEEITRQFMSEPAEDVQFTFGDSVCAICDDGGGDLVCCDGACMRSFHAKPGDGTDSSCESLKLTDKEVEELADAPFWCPNCRAFQHQCYICGKLGNSDKQNALCEVYKCEVPGCGHFYHPSCLAKYELPSGMLAEVESRVAAIKDSKNFLECPLHTCEVCRKPEKNMEQTDGALVKCRRCPVAYHVECLPEDIPRFGSRGDPQRAWGPGVEEEKSIDQRLCYCRKHAIDMDLGTPKRNHLKLKPRTRAPLLIQAPKQSESPALPTPKLKTPLASVTPTKVDSPRKEAKLALATGAAGSPPSTRVELPEAIAKTPPGSKPSESTVENDSVPLAEEAEVQVNEEESVLPPAFGAGLEQAKVVAESGVMEEVPGFEAEPVEEDVGLQVIAETEAEDGPATLLEPHVAAADDEVGEIPWEGMLVVGPEGAAQSEELEKLLDKLEQEAEGAITMTHVRGVLVTPSIYSSSGDTRSRIMPKSRLEPICNAVEKAKAAVVKGDPETARRICQQGIPGGDRQIDEIKRLESVMRVYLAPMLHGSRYTSFGRHFTQYDKLVEVVEKLHPYVDNGDVIVDFCCGANDFSIILAQKLNALGKTDCQYVNFDLITAKNDFNFTKKDWFHVTRADLNFEGRRLIMGLNPPFGVNAALANKFIDHALTWDPKLLILIVPPETRRLEDRNYSMCWEDHVVVSGRSFYLPGSVNKSTQEALDQWNKVTPPLYLWSHNNFYNKHMAIAQALGHGNIFDPNKPPPAGTSPAYEEYKRMEEQRRQDHAYHLQQQQQQALQPQWGPFPGVLQNPPFHFGPTFIPTPNAPHFEPGGFALPQFEPPPLGGNQHEMHRAAIDAQVAILRGIEGELQGTRQRLTEALAEHQQCLTHKHAWSSKFQELKAENERLQAVKADLTEKIVDRQEKCHIFAYTGDHPARIRCEAEIYGLEGQRRAIDGEIQESEVNGKSVLEKMLEFDALLADFGGRVKEREAEMERVTVVQREQLATIERVKVEQQQHIQNEAQMFAGAGTYPGAGGMHMTGGLPPNLGAVHMGQVHMGPVHTDGGMGDMRPNAPLEGAYAHEAPGPSYGANRPNREERRHERRGAGAPYPNDSGKRDRGQRPSSQGNQNNPDRRGGRGMDRQRWPEHRPEGVRPIERGEPLMPTDGQWLSGRENDVMPGPLMGELPPPPPFMPPNAEFHGFPNGPLPPPPHPPPPFF